MRLRADDLAGVAADVLVEARAEARLPDVRLAAAVPFAVFAVERRVAVLVEAASAKSPLTSSAARVKQAYCRKPGRRSISVV